MYLSYKWLKELANLPKGVSFERLGNDLTMKTAEVEGIESLAKDLDNVVAGKIIEINDHPDADKVNIAQVDLGVIGVKNIVFGKALQIVSGDIVPVALPGAILPGGVKIEKRKMRGQMSEGMLCVDVELGFEGSAYAITKFPEKTKLGEPIIKTMKLDDHAIEIDNKSLTHRPDLWGHVGMAREVAAIYGTKLADPAAGIEKKATKTEVLGRSVEKSELPKLTANIQAKKACLRYTALRIENVTIADSSSEIKARLLACGIRPINNIVDVTNYVMYEQGQPLHAFDAKKVSDQKISVRFAKAEEIFTTPDDTERDLTSQDLVISDGKKPVALAGVMGGANSEVQNNTDSIILESATFDPVIIRKTASRLALQSDSSQRFEKTLDPLLAPKALLRAAELILEQCPDAKITSEVVDVKNFTQKKTKVTVDTDFLNDRFGFALPKQKVVSILKSLEFGVSGKGNKLVVDVPSFRATKDISIPEDIVEEVARMYGYDDFPVELPELKLLYRPENPERLLERKTKNILKTLGWNEVYNYSFLHEKDIKRCGLKPEDHIELQNPAAEGQQYMRTSLIPGLLLSAKSNMRFYEDFRIFELDRIFKKQPGKFEVKPGEAMKLPSQPYQLAGLWFSKTTDPLFEVKGVLQNLLAGLDMQALIDSTKAGIVWTEPGTTGKITVDDKPVGIIARVHKDVLAAFKLKGNASLFVINFGDLAVMRPTSKTYQEIPKFPSISRDVAFVCDSSRSALEIEQSLKGVDGLITNVEIFDVYRGKQVPKGKRSVALRVTYQDPSRTLKDAEVDHIQQKLVKKLEQEFNAEIRSE